MNNYQVGKLYEARNFNQTGYDFPAGTYELKIIHQGFPKKNINNEDELIVARELWLEGFEDTEHFEEDLNGNWYYFSFPANDKSIEYMWIPESVVVEVFK